VTPLETTLLDGLARFGPLALALTIVAGSLGAPLPLSMLLLAAGALARQGLLELHATVMLAIAGAVMGDSASYGLGRFGGRLLRRSFGTASRSSREEAMAWRQARSALEHRGGLSIFLTRWLLTPLALPVNLLAGSRRYPLGLFLLWDVLGEASWVVLYVGLGYFFADRWQALHSWTGNLTVALLALGLASLLSYSLLRAWRGRAMRAWGRIILGTMQPQWQAAFRLTQADPWRDEVFRSLDHPQLLEQPAAFELSLPSTFGGEKLLRYTVAWLALRLELPVEKIADLQTAVSEAYLNAVEHGNRGRRRLRIQIIFTITAEHLEIEVVDQGLGQYRESEEPPATIEDRVGGQAPARGLGLLLIRQLVDEAEFVQRTNDRGNHFRLRVRRPSLPETGL
jgi:membrane-associated protein